MDWRERIVRYRKRAKLTQPELAELFGVDERTVRRWEAGQTRPPEEIRKRLFATPVPAVELPNAAGVRLLIETSSLHSVLLDEKCKIITASPVYAQRMRHVHGDAWASKPYLSLLPPTISDFIDDVWRRNGGYERMLKDGLSSMAHDYHVPVTAKDGTKTEVTVRGIGSRLFVDSSNSFMVLTSYNTPKDGPTFYDNQLTYLDDVMKEE